MEEGLNTLRDLQCSWNREHGIIKIKYKLSSNWFMDGRKWSRQTLWAKENFSGKILRPLCISACSSSLSPSASYSLRLGHSRYWATSTLQGGGQFFGPCTPLTTRMPIEWLCISQLTGSQDILQLWLRSCSLLGLLPWTFWPSKASLN